MFAFCEVEPTAFSEEDSRLVLSRVAVLLMLLVMLSALSVSAAASAVLAWAVLAWAVVEAAEEVEATAARVFSRVGACICPSLI